ncbi:hypothetical protein AVEN_181908-1, partial [Araneus ventricosus]
MSSLVLLPNVVEFQRIDRATEDSEY